MKERTKKKKKQLDDDSKLRFLSRILPVADGAKNSQKKNDLNYLDLSSSSDHSLTGSMRLSQITELVKKPSTELPEVRQRRRGARKRSVSDGVAAMRLFSTTSAVASEALMNSEGENEPLSLSPQPIKPRARGRRQKSHSTGVFLMQSEIPKSMFFEKEESLQVPGAGNENEIQTSRLSEKSEDMPKSLRQKKFIMPISEGSENGSSEKAENDDDDISEGLPEIFDSGNIQDDKEEGIPLDTLICQMLLSHKWRRLSAVCGTYVIFFLIAARIEVILIETCAIQGTKTIWMAFISFLLIYYPTHHLYSSDTFSIQTTRTHGISSLENGRFGL